MFSGSFRAPFPSPIASPGVVAELWYLAGGVALANCKRAYAAIGAASQAASYVNLANPGTGDAAAVGSVSWSAAAGWGAFLSATAYLTTGYTQPANTNFTIIIRYSGGLNGTYALSVCTDNSGLLNLGIFASLGGGVFYAHNAQATRAPQLAAGVVGLAGGQPYRNGATDGASLVAASATWRTLHIGKYNPTSGAVYSFPGNIQALAIYDANLSAAQMLAISTAMSELTG